MNNIGLITNKAKPPSSGHLMIQETQGIIAGQKEHERSATFSDYLSVDMSGK